jgi:hypothetical protein
VVAVLKRMLMLLEMVVAVQVDRVFVTARLGRLTQESVVVVMHVVVVVNVLVVVSKYAATATLATIKERHLWLCGLGASIGSSGKCRGTGCCALEGCIMREHIWQSSISGCGARKEGARILWVCPNAVPDLQGAALIEGRGDGAELSLDGGVPPVLDGVVRAPWHFAGDARPVVAVEAVEGEQPLLLAQCPRPLGDVGVEVVEPPLAALLARAPRQVARDAGPVSRAVLCD